jgi:hypothetical protein
MARASAETTQLAAEEHTMKRAYVAPQLEEYGTVADLTQVGLTNPGPDTFPGDEPGRDGGSICPDGEGGPTC